jgi:hypothetical protein
LEEATWGTSFAPSIKPFQRAKNGRGAFDAIINQYAGDDKWESEIKAKEAILHTIKWKGQSNYSLEHQSAQHRNSYVLLVACAEHVDYQLPNGHSRVGYLLDSIQNNDPGLQAVMANVRSSKGADGMMSDFEQTIAHIIPYCPVAKKKTLGAKGGVGEISALNSDKHDGNISSVGTKNGRWPKPGTHLRNHKHSEYQKLSEDEQSELRKWRSTQGTQGGRRKEKSTKKGKYDAKYIAAVVEKKIAAQLKAAQVSSTQEAEAEAFIASCIQNFADGNLPVPVPSKPTMTATTSSAEAGSA